MKLELYYKPTCPYCQKVLTFMKTAGISLPLQDISSSEEARQTLIRVGSKQQVPCLFIDGKAMYESDDIIEFFKKTK